MILHHQVIGTDVVERADIGMVQRGHRSGLSLEAVGESFVRDFDGDVAVEARIARAIHLAHAARADGREDLVRTQVSSGSQRHGRETILP